jgi:transcriptional antiterminator NusG
MSDVEKKWYVLRAISGKERKVKEYIENEIKALNLEEFIAQVVIPSEKVFQIRNGKKISKERNYYPGYVLVEAALIGEVAHTLINIPNVISFVGADKGKIPVPLRPDEVKHILGIVDKLIDTDEQISQPFFVGEEVKVIDGPFNDFIGIIEEVNEEKKKLKVMVKIFGRKAPLELKFSQVEKQF